MTKEQINLKLNTCFKKANLGLYLFSLDEDEDADFYFDAEDYFCIYNVRTPYKEEDLLRIKFRYFDEGDDWERESYVKIDFRNGDSLFIKAYDMEANIFNGQYWRSYGSECEVLKKYKDISEDIQLGVCGNDYIIKNGVLTTYNGKGHVVIPEGVTKIEDGVLEKCQMEEIKMPLSMRNIGKYNFRDCKSLSQVVLNEGIECIDDRAFCGCTALKHIAIPASVKYIGPFAFGLSGIETVDLPHSDIQIAPDAFQDTPYEKKQGKYFKFKNRRATINPQ